MADSNVLFKALKNDTTVSSTATNTNFPDEPITAGAERTQGIIPFWEVPVANSAAEFASNHISITLEGNTVAFTLWQTGGTIYFSQTNTWNNNAPMEIVGSGSTGAFKVTEVDSKPWVVGELTVEDM